MSSAASEASGVGGHGRAVISRQGLWEVVSGVYQSGHPGQDGLCPVGGRVKVS